MMRIALWLTALFAIAVAAAWFAQSNQGQVALLWPPWQVDISANLAIAALVLAFALLYALLRTAATVAQIPAQARRWRRQRQERALIQHLLHASTHADSGRFVRTRKAALAALDVHAALAQKKRLPRARAARLLQLRCTALMLAAEAAHALQEPRQRAQHWQAILDSTQGQGSALAHEIRHGAHLRAAQWALQELNATQALHHLGQLPQGSARRTLALRLRLKAEQLAGDSAAALATARLLAKHHALSSTAAASVVRALLLDSLHQARDSVQLQRLWQSLDSAQRRNPEIALAASGRLLELARQETAQPAADSGGGQATRARAWLLPAWEQMLEADTPEKMPDAAQLAQLVQTLQDCLEGLDSAWLARMEAAARRYPQQACLQYLAGMACVQRQLWGKAQQLLLRAASQLPQAALRNRAWRQLALMAEHRKDPDAALHAWRQAALAGQ